MNELTEIEAALIQAWLSKNEPSVRFKDVDSDYYEEKLVRVRNY